MRNPYQVLGVSENATEEQIKSAYKELVKKYHPDKYVNNPLADLAEEKLKEINEAYSAIQKNDKNSGTSSQSTSYNKRQSYQGSNSAKYLHVRSYINSKRYNDAYTVLSAMSDRDAEWYYLSSVVASNFGWLDQALQHISTAVRLDPTNIEYRNAMNQMNNANNMYRQYSQSKGYGSNPSACQLCTCLCCGDTCCECMGGDLIGCC